MVPRLLGSAFHLWERATSAYLEALAQSPLLLSTAGSWMGWALGSKRLSDSGLQGLVSLLGLATRRDQERTLHLLQQIEGRLDDLELRSGLPHGRPCPPVGPRDPMIDGSG